MSTRPTGRFSQREDGLYLLLDRLFQAPIEDVWWSITRPAELEKWIGTYTGNPATGAVKFKMTAEGDDAEWEYTSILSCAAPHSFHIDVGESENKMRLFCHLTEAGGLTTLTLGQRLKSPTDAAQMGPGWDYYLDRLIAARARAPLPAWESYYPVHAAHYESLVVPSKTA